MPINRHEIVDELPITLEPNTLYFVNASGSHRVVSTDETATIISYLDLNIASGYAQLLYSGSTALTSSTPGSSRLTDVNYTTLTYTSVGSFTNPLVNRIQCNFDGKVQLFLDATFEGGNGSDTTHALRVVKNNSAEGSLCIVSANGAALSGSQKAQHHTKNGMIIDVVDGDYFDLRYTCPTGVTLWNPTFVIKRIS